MKKKYYGYRIGIIILITFFSYVAYGLQGSYNHDSFMKFFGFFERKETLHSAVHSKRIDTFKNQNVAVVLQNFALQTAAEGSTYLLIPELDIITPIHEPKFNNPEEVEQKLHQGVVRDIASAPIGLQGKTVILGHSSHDTESLFSEIFATLPDISLESEIYIADTGKIHRYIAQSTEVVPPKDRSILEPKSKNTELTLYTCYPIGTTDKRFVLHAEKQDLVL